MTWVWKLSTFLFYHRISMSDVEFDDTLVDTHISQSWKGRSTSGIKVSTLCMYVTFWHSQLQKPVLCEMYVLKNCYF